MKLGSLLFLLSLPVIAFTLHVVGRRLPPFRRFAPLKLAAYSAGGAIVVAGGGWSWLEGSLVSTSGILVALWLCPLLAHLYFNFFALSETARRIRLLVNLKLQSRTSPTIYSADSVIQVRIDRMVELHQITLRQDRYICRPTPLLWVSRLLKLHERLLFPDRQPKR
jgi:hypothetical protein